MVSEFLHNSTTDDIDKLLELLHQLRAIFKNSQTTTIISIYEESMTNMDRRQMESLMETWKKIMNDHGAKCSTFVDFFETKEKLISNFEECIGFQLRINMERFQVMTKRLIKSKEVPLPNFMEALNLFNAKYSEDCSRYVEAFCHDSLAPLCRKIPKHDMTLFPSEERVNIITPMQVQDFINTLSIAQQFIDDDANFVLCCLLILFKREENPHSLNKWLLKMLSKNVSNASHTFPNADEAISGFFNAMTELDRMFANKVSSLMPNEE